MSESSIQRQIRARLGELRVPMFRNNVGTGWSGSKVIHHGDGSVTILNARPLQAGLCKGSADLIGWVPTVITPEMVGTKFARFCSIEVKTPKGRLSSEQTEWLRILTEHGGAAGVARSPEDAQRIIGL